MVMQGMYITDVLIQIFITISQPLCKIITNKHVHIDVPQYESILVSTVFSNYICDKYILLLMRIGTQVLNSSLWYWDFYFRKFNYHWINNTWIQLIVEFSGWHWIRDGTIKDVSAKKKKHNELIVMNFY